MNRTTLAGLVSAIGMIALGFPAVAEPVPMGGPDPDIRVFDFDELDCNPTGYADYCPKSGRYLDIDTMDVYRWDTGSSVGLVEEFRPPSLTKTGEKASGYVGFVQTDPKFEGETYGQATCNANVCVAFKIAIVAQEQCPATVHIRYLTPVYGEPIYPIGYAWLETSRVVGQCNAAVTYANGLSLFGGPACRNATVTSWIQFAGDSTAYGTGSRDAVRSTCY